MNEELRSSAEELETSKEELQSLNEELRTVNQELKIKVEEQVQANDDIQNLINSAEIGTIFLDRSSRIKLFTPRAKDIFTLDSGRPWPTVVRYQQLAGRRRPPAGHRPCARTSGTGGARSPHA